MDLISMSDADLDAHIAALQSQYKTENPILPALASAESSNNTNAVSSAGAAGKYQIEPATAANPGYGVTPLRGWDGKDPRTAPQAEQERFANDYLNAMIKHNGGDTTQGLMAYNGGPGTVDNWKSGKGLLPKETQAYPNRVYAQNNNIMSDANVDTAPVSPDLSTLSDAELDAQIAKLQGPQGIGDRISADWANRTKEQKNIANQVAQGQIPEWQGLPEIALKQARKGADVVGEGLSNVWGNDPNEPIQHGIASAVGWLGNKAAQSLPGRTLGIASKATDIASAQNPQIAGGVGAVKDIANIAGAATAADAMGNVALAAGKTALNSAPAMAANEYGGMAVRPPSAKSLAEAYDPIATHSAISDTYGAAKEQAGRYYDFMHNLAEGRSAPATGIKSSLDSIISDIESDPLHEARTQLPYLRRLSESIGDSDALPLPDVVKLKQNLNANFNPKRFTQGADTPYQMLGSSVDYSLKKAAKTYPDFGEAKSLADKNWLNTVKSPFEDNKVLQKFWQPEDYYAKNSIENGMLDELPDATKQRAQTMLQKVGNPVQLDSVRRVLPQNLADTFSAAKVHNLTQGLGTGRLNSAGKAIMGAPNLTPSGIANTGRNLMNVISPQIDAEAQVLIDAARSPSPRLSTKYSDQFAGMKEWAQNPKLSPLNPMKALPAPENPTVLALPAPERPIVVGGTYQGEGGHAAPRPMTDDELALHNLPPEEQAKRVQRVPQSYQPTEIEQMTAAQHNAAAWDAQAQELSAAGKTAKEIQNQLGKRPVPPTIPQDYGTGANQIIARTKNINEWNKASKALSNAGLTPLEIERKIGKIPSMPEYKKGGSVKPSLASQFLARKYA